jgi:hypothetical protein
MLGYIHAELVPQAVKPSSKAEYLLYIGSIAEKKEHQQARKRSGREEYKVPSQSGITGITVAFVVRQISSIWKKK